MNLLQSRVHHSWFSVIFLAVFLCLVTEIEAAQKKGFRGGERSYGIKVEANPIGTNLYYKLPEAKAKSSSPMDWKVDNDNAKMVIALNSPVAAFVYTTNPKFNVQGQWPGYKINLKLPKDVKTAKKNELGKVANDEPSGSGVDLSLIPVTSSSGSGAFWSGVSGDSSGSGAPELVTQSGEDLAGFERSVSGSGEEDLQRRDGEEVGELNLPLKRRSKVEHKIKTKIHQRKTKNEIKQPEDDDLFLRKVKHAVEKLKHFDLHDPKTRKSLKAIITHAKRVVNEAKMVLRDVASVVRSVQNFVTGKFDTAEDQELLNMTLLDDGQKAREDAEHAAHQANVAANKAQAASEMAKEIADNFWKVAQKSRALTKLGDVVSPLKNPAMKKFVKIHDNSHQRDILLKGKDGVNDAENLKHFKNQTVVKEQEKTGNVMATRLEGKPSKNATKTGSFINNNKSTNSVGEIFENDKEIKLDENAANPDEKRKESKKPTKVNDNAKRIRPALVQKQSQLPRNLTKSKESRNQLKNADKTTTEKAKEPLTTNEEEILISKADDIEKKDAELQKEMASLITYKVTKLPNSKSKKTEKDNVKNLTPRVEKKVVKSDGSENTKTVSHLMQNQAPKNKQEIKANESKIKKQSKDSVKTESKNQHHVTTNDQPGSVISGSYDVELEVEPEKLEFSKGEGKMKEKRIRIKSMTADGKNRQISPVTFGKILKAIRKVEGILGFTIEKERENSKKSNKIHK